MREGLDEKICQYIKICPNSRDDNLCRKYYETNCNNYFLYILDEIRNYRKLGDVIA